MKTIFLNLFLLFCVSNYSQLSIVVPNNYDFFAGSFLSRNNITQEIYVIRNGYKIYKSNQGGWTYITQLSNINLSTASPSFPYQYSVDDVLQIGSDGYIYVANFVTNTVQRSPDGVTWQTISLPPLVTYYDEVINKKIIYKNNKLYYTRVIFPQGECSTALYTLNNDLSWQSLPLNGVGQGYGYGGCNLNPFKILDNGAIHNPQNNTVSYDQGITWSQFLTVPTLFPDYNYYPSVSYNVNDAIILAQWPNGVALKISYNFGVTYSDLIPSWPSYLPVKYLGKINTKLYLKVGYFGNGEAEFYDGIYSYDIITNVTTKFESGLNFWDNQKINFISNNEFAYISISNLGFMRFNNQNSGIPFNNGIDNSFPFNINGIDIDNNGIIYVMTKGSGIYRSGDDGITWQRDLNLFDRYYSGPGFGNLLFSTSQGNKVFVGGYDPGKIQTSNDSGSTFSTGNQFYVSSIVGIYADKANGNRLITTCVAPDGAYKGTFLSNDGGISWGTLSTGFANPIDGEIATNVLFKGNYIYILFNNRIKLSNNNGLNWSNINTPTFRNIVYDSVDDVLYACTTDAIYKSLNNGINWSQIISPPLSNIKKILIIDDEQSVSKKLLISSDSGLFTYKDNNFISLNQGIFDFVAYNTQSKKIFLSNQNSTGIFTLNSQTLKSSLMQSNNYFVKIYPNPSDRDITIQNSNQTNEIFTFQIFDMIGRIVKSGNAFFSEKIEIESLNSGSYIIKIITENGEIQSQKFIKK